MNLRLEVLEFFLHVRDSGLHLLDERLGVLRHREESDVVLVCIEVLLKFVVLLNQAILLGLAGILTSATLSGAKYIMKFGRHRIIVCLCNLVLFLERHKTDFLPSCSKFLTCFRKRGLSVRNKSIDFLYESLLRPEVCAIVVL